MREGLIDEAGQISDAELAIHLRRKEVERRSDLVWSTLKTSFFAMVAVRVLDGIGMASIASLGNHLITGPEAVSIGASVGALHLSLKLIGEGLRRTPRDVPPEFVDELRAKAADVAAHRNGKGLWIVRDPQETAPRVMTEGEFAGYEKMLAAQDRGLDRLSIDGNKLTLCRYVGGKLHAENGEPAVVKIDLKTGKGTSAFFTDGQKACVNPEDAKLPFTASRGI
jgi:hypothetical protein